MSLAKEKCMTYVSGTGHLQKITLACPEHFQVSTSVHNTSFCR